MTAKARASQPFLVDTLAAAFGGRLEAGAEFGGELIAGDLVVEVSVRVRRRVTRDDARAHREGALAFLRGHAGRVKHCGCWLKGRRSGQCQGRVVAAVVCSGTSGEKTSYTFICGRHRESHGIDARHILAVVVLDESDLAPIRKQAADEDAAYVRRELERNAKALEAALPAFADPAGVPAGWTYEAPTFCRDGSVDRRPQWSFTEGGVRLLVTLYADSFDTYCGWHAWRGHRRIGDDVTPGRRAIGLARNAAFGACIKAAATGGDT